MRSRRRVPSASLLSPVGAWPKRVVVDATQSSGWEAGTALSWRNAPILPAPG